MRRFLTAVVAVVAVTAVTSVAVGAAPIPGAERVTYSVTSGGRATNVSGYVSPTPECPGWRPNTPWTSAITAVVSGWYGPVYDFDKQDVQLQAHLSGTTTDASGATYRVSGHFTDTSTKSLFRGDHPFGGDGTFVLTGDSGVLVGDAHFDIELVTGVELHIAFTTVHACTFK